MLAFGLATEGAGIPATLRKPSPEQKAWWALGKELGIEPSAGRAPRGLAVLQATRLLGIKPKRRSWLRHMIPLVARWSAVSAAGGS